MKKIIFLLLIFTSLFVYSNEPKLPDEVRTGECMEKVIEQYPLFHFKFYKEAENGLMSFGMLGYWVNGRGFVILFNNNAASMFVGFVCLQCYWRYITNPEEEENIEIIEDNFF